ncbi:DUF2550 family protein [Arthrobacter sp. GMC3]|uniref:DUF2550 family protein n=1 Tax=Arthrobacter sp. GMC3 TaxID=2058894 RepID=UPI000CE366DF|nr:DUF2550 family protein [Arthrobacter sp. GMC3]
MLIALLVVLGVDLIVVVALVALIFTRRRWLKGQPGEFSGAIRVVKGEIHGLPTKWKRGSGRWVRDVLVWSKGPLLFRNEMLAVDRASDQRPLTASEVKRLGDHPVAVRFESGQAAFELAVPAEQVPLALGTFQTAGDNPFS